MNGCNLYKEIYRDVCRCSPNDSTMLFCTEILDNWPVDWLLVFELYM